MHVSHKVSTNRGLETKVIHSNGCVGEPPHTQHLSWKRITRRTEEETSCSGKYISKLLGVEWMRRGGVVWK